ncbi:disease resistance protein [Dorcoceras hygrometricum]|uniref:Disease resistance protein n=1 Tax=Dorcoceras hygrometricum TaxID=472368 RepID=A0A2Z7CDM7_9LAMI|nr:disease resistance protein [Dorcoceras hygrometricum]
MNQLVHVLRSLLKKYNEEEEPVARYQLEAYVLYQLDNQTQAQHPVEAVTSSYSADGLKEQSQESAGSLHPDARGSDVVEEIFSRKLLFTSRCYLEIAIAKRCHLHKLIRQRFALALKIQQEDFALMKNQSQDTSWKHMFYTSWTTRRKHSIQSKSLYESAVATQPVASFASSRKDPDTRKADVAKHCNQAQNLSPVLFFVFILDVQEQRAIAAPVNISSEQKFRKPFKRALAADLLVILNSYGPSSGIRAAVATQPVASFASSRKDPDTRKADVAKHCNQAQSIQSTKISAEDESSRSDDSAAKQLITYEELSKLDVNC